MLLAPESKSLEGASEYRQSQSQVPVEGRKVDAGVSATTMGSSATRKDLYSREFLKQKEM